VEHAEWRAKDFAVLELVLLYWSIGHEILARRQSRRRLFSLEYL
jgi:hypothetical protein